MHHFLSATASSETASPFFSITVTGKRAEDNGKGDYLHRGIAARAFERRFQLADFVEAGNASFENGLLSIALKRVGPEAMKAPRIEIGGSNESGRASGRGRVCQYV